MKTALAILVALLLALPFRTAAGQDGSAAARRRVRVMVLVPEQHLARPRIPDPAVETELCRQLIEAGYRVVDQERVAALRYQAVVDRIVKGGPNAAKEAVVLGRRFGADVLVTGEAFTQEVARRQVSTDLGPTTVIQCRARVELKAIRTDTGEKFYADALQRTGPGEPTEELSSKACLQDAAEAMSPDLVLRLERVATVAERTVELHVRGVGSAARAAAVEAALRQVPGVRDVLPGDYEGDTYETELRVTPAAARTLPAALETHPALKRFGLKVRSSSAARIVCDAAPAPAGKPRK